MGGSATWQLFPSDIGTFVREVLQNANDQKQEDRDSVHVTFRFDAISGAPLDTFLEGLSWSTLEPHLKGAAARDYVTISPRIRSTLEALSQGGELIVLAIEDVGTEGLTGDEDAEDGNFSLLTRHELVTSESRSDRGGSFGVGKSVLWRFSSLSTVLFSSRVNQDDVLRDRFFGRVYLPFHETGAGEAVERWSGSGWIGRPEKHGYGERAVSLWDEEARARAAQTLTERAAGESGATVLIVGFAEPNLEQPRDLEDVCADMTAAVGEWFWPAMTSGRLKVTIEGRRQGAEVFRQKAEPGPAVQPFVLAERHGGPFAEALSAPGEVSERSIPVDVPAQRVGPEDPPVPAVPGQARLRLRLAQSQEQERAFSVALRRGTGMVVRYLPIPRGVSDDAAFHGVLTAGTALSESEQDHAVEQFLRSAEPPEHKEWTAKTDRMAARYHAGAGASLDRFTNHIRNAVREVTEQADRDGEELPAHVRRLFPIAPEGEGPPPPPSSRLEDAQAMLSSGEWRFSGRYRTRASSGDWAFRVRLILDEETGRGERAVITELDVTGGSSSGPDGDGSWLVRVPSGITEVGFSGIAPAEGLLPGTALHRTRVRLFAQLERDA